MMKRIGHALPLDRACGTGGVEFQGGAVVEPSPLVAGCRGGVADFAGGPQGAPTGEDAECQRSRYAAPRQDARPAPGHANRRRLGRGGRKRHHGGGTIEGGVDFSAELREFVKQPECLLQAHDDGGVPRIGAEPLRKLPFAHGRKSVVTLGEPRDRGVLDGDGGGRRVVRAGHRFTRLILARGGRAPIRERRRRDRAPRKSAHSRARPSTGGP